MRRTLIITAVVLVLAGIGAVAYFYFFMSSAGVVVAPPGSVSLPVAGQGTPLPGGATGLPSVSPSVPTAVSARLIKISAGPIVPGVVVVNKAGNASSSPETTVTYIERQSGNVFSYHTAAKTLTRTSNKTIPGIQSASWLPNASFAFVRYLSGDDFSTINTYALPADGDGGFFLPQDLADVAVSSTSILMLASGVTGSTASLAQTNGTRSKAVFSTPLSALRASFAGKSQYLATTKPSATLPGATFLVDTAGNFSRVAGPHNGLTALASPSGKWVLVSYILGAAIEMKLVNPVTNETFPLPIATIADKCAWAADDSVIYCGIPESLATGAIYPDDWYQGVAHFSDRIWKIQVSGRYAQLVLDLSAEAKESVDIESPAIDPLGTTLVFVNKNDGSLWSYSL